MSGNDSDTLPARSPGVQIQRSRSAADGLAKLDPKAQVLIAKGVADAIVAIAQSVQIVIRGREYRASLAAIVKTLQEEQRMRHDDVRVLLAILKECGPEMTQAVRDQYYLAILDLLRTPGLAVELPPPRY